MPQIIITCPPGFEYLLVDECKSLGADDAREGLTQVLVDGDWPLIYRICLWSRLANRVLFPIAQFEALDEQSLYQACMEIPWDIHFSVEQTFAVTSVLRRSKLNHEKFVALKVKDAIADFFRENYQQRPSVDTTQPDVRVQCRVNKNQCTLCIDLSGSGLHQRGYRERAGEAPIKENLAAAMVYRADWPARYAAGEVFMDPMCGSGTIAIEAAMMALDRAPGLDRQYWGFLGWKRHQAALWQAELESAQDRFKAAQSTARKCIFANDIDASVIEIARENAALAGVSELIEFSEKPFAELTPPAESTSGVLVTNPPYGERLEDSQRVTRLYQQLGQWLKQSFVGWQALILSTDKQHGHAIGIRAQKIYRFRNGALQCELLKLPISAEHFVQAKQEVTAENYQQQISPEAQALNNRLKKNLAALKSFLKQKSISCYRLYDAELPEYAAAIDVYESSAHIQEYAPPKSVDLNKAKRRLRDIETVVAGFLDIPAERVHTKTRMRQRGDTQYGKQDQQGAIDIAREGRAKFEINLSDYLDTGLFIDHRKARQLLGEWSEPGTRLLNLYCYTATASVHAALAGAITTNVDLSNTYLNWGQRNFSLNGIDINHHEFIRADCMQWLEQAAQQKPKFDLIFIDPPTFSNSKKMEQHFDIQEQHQALLKLATALLAPGGRLLFSNNFKKFKMLFEPPAGYTMVEFTRETTSRDFSKKPLHRSWLITSKQ